LTWVAVPVRNRRAATRPEVKSGLLEILVQATPAPVQEKEYDGYFHKKDVETFYAQQQRRRRISSGLNELEDILIEGRDKHAIPIYLTKQR
jgi:hypothetical protein